VGSLGLFQRVFSLCDRLSASLASGVVRVFPHEGANVARAVSELSTSALEAMKYMPPNISPPAILPYIATDVHLGLPSSSMSDSGLNDIAQNFVRPDLAVVHRLPPHTAASPAS
jgi:hypothetical protein